MRVKTRALIAALVALVGMPFVLTAPPATASTVRTAQAPKTSSSSGSQSAVASLDIRAGLWPTGYPTALGSIKPGDAETFTVSVYGPLSSSKYGTLTMGQVAADFGHKHVHFRLYYGWGQAGVTTENGCTEIGKGVTAFCNQQSSTVYYGPSKANPNGSKATTWEPTTAIPAPSSDLSTLFDAIWLIPGQPGDHAAPLLESAAGNYTYGQTAKQVFLTSSWGSGNVSVAYKTKVFFEACITDGTCSKGLVPSGNYLADYLYICDQWPPTGSDGKGLPVNGRLYTSGKADGVLGGTGSGAVTQEFDPPPGQDWTLDYSAFASSHANLASTADCPSSPSAVKAGSAGGITDNFSSMQVTWDGPVAVPPQVSLTVTPANPSASEAVKLLASATSPDGNSELFICARSGTSWLSLSAPDVNGYLGAAPVTSLAPEALGTAVPTSGRGGTAQFVAFFSKKTSPPQSCPATDVASATYGTTYPPEWSAKAGPWKGSYDYSQPVNVTWPVPSSTLTGAPGVTLRALPTSTHVDQTVTLQATYANLPSGYRSLFICSRTSGSWLHMSGAAPYAASSAVPANADAVGSAFATSPGKATFIAFLSTKATPPSSCPGADAASGQWGTSKPSGWTAAWGATEAFSSPLTVSWSGGGSSTPPSVSLSIAQSSLAFGESTTLSASYSNPGPANAVYICSPGDLPWLVTSYNNGYVSELALPAGGQANGSVSGSPGASGGTASFVAFLSSKSSPPTTCPLTDAPSAAAGTTTAADYSNRVSATWAGAPPGRATVALTVNHPNPGAGQRVTFTASYSHPGAANAVYICMLPGTAGVTTSGRSPYLASAGVPPGATTGQVTGWASSPGAASASFLAYLSTEVGQQGSGSCPGSLGQHGSIALSSVVNVTWGSQPPPVAGIGPIVSISVNANNVPIGYPVTVTATYLSPGTAKALYITDQGITPPNFSYPYGTIEPVKHLPYVAAHPVPTFPDAAATISDRTSQSVQFDAFLSTLDGLQAGPTYADGKQTAVVAPGPGEVSPSFGTTTPADFSPVVAVTWGSIPTGTVISLRASSVPSAPDQKITFTATATGLPAGSYLYVCGVPGGSGTFSPSGLGVISKAQSPVVTGQASGNGGSADFIAFSSPYSGWGWCPTAPYNWPPAPGTGIYYIPAVSNIVSVAWPGGKKPVQWYPT